MITVNCLSHWFGDKQVLDNLSLTVRDGEILGLIGVNGAGKSTFLRLISGVMTPTEGDVWYDGLPISKGETRKNMFFLPDDPFYEVGMTCRDLFNLYQTFYPGIQRDVFDDLIGFAGLPSRKPLSSFSKGMRRQAFSAIAFAIAPKYLLLDEAFDGLDPLARERFKGMVREQANRGCTIIISSHALKELDGFCDNYLILSDKRFISPDHVAAKINSLVKFQVVFETEPTKVMFEALKLRHYQQNGRVVTLIAEGDEQIIRKRIDALQPILVDRLEIEPGEILIDTMEELTRGGGSL